MLFEYLECKCVNLLKNKMQNKINKDYEGTLENAYKIGREKLKLYSVRS